MLRNYDPIIVMLISYLLIFQILNNLTNLPFNLFLACYKSVPLYIINIFYNETLYYFRCITFINGPL